MVNNLKACILAVENGEFKKLLHSSTEEKIKKKDDLKRGWQVSKSYGGSITLAWTWRPKSLRINTVGKYFSINSKL